MIDKTVKDAFEKAGENPDVFSDKGIASLVINSNKTLFKNEIRGIKIEQKSFENGVDIVVSVQDNTIIEKPVHLCFGMLPKEGKQIINSKFYIGKNSKVSFLAHCSFPNAENIQHLMNSEVHLKENAVMEYLEQHYHSESGGVFVKPVLRGVLEKGASLREEFKIVKGQVGKLHIDYSLELRERAGCDITTKVFGKARDDITVNESLFLNGKYAGGTLKSRIVLTDHAKGNVLGLIEGNAPYSKGHIDCHEIVQGNFASAESSPIIRVKNPLARITHEAAIGRINKKELETLMARGLSEEEAVNMIVRGVLRG